MCPTASTTAPRALAYGDASDPEGELCKRVDELRAKGFRIYELPAYEESRSGILYAQRVG